MKVYIDENDIDRKIATYHDITNTQQGLYIYGKDKIIIQSLSDYAKQVRKEVAGEIKSTLRKKVAKMMGYRHCYPESAIYWDEVVTILDKIEKKND